VDVSTPPGSFVAGCRGRKYNTTKTLEAFSAQLRDETDLDALSDGLVTVVRETMQPEHASLWLTPPGRREPYESEVRNV
jgi:hypothetical protein